MKRLFGGLLQAAGILIAGASGLCSFFFIVSMLPQSGNPNGVLGVLGLVSVVGGVPFLLGFGLFRWGRWVVQSAERDDEDIYR